MMLPRSDELTVATLGPCRFPNRPSDASVAFVDESRRVLLSTDTMDLQSLPAGQQPPSFELAGPRRQIYFDVQQLTCGVVTCGGLCPGINNVIRSVVMTLSYTFGVRRILGFRYGYAGLSQSGQPPMSLTPEAVDRIHEFGGTILGTSRGPQAVSDMVDTLTRHAVGILFVIGGDGTLRGAAAIAGEIARRGLALAVVGIPKTIDNDIEWITRSFGFGTAVEAARAVICGAHSEALGVWNGIGLVKLMGRQSGFIAAHAALANSDVNFCLVPEVPFALDGEAGLLRVLERRFEHKRHALIVVAEGAGQELIDGSGNDERDASGNLKLKDIGAFLKACIAEHFHRRGIPVTIRYIDPSYGIRSQPANSMDASFCLALGQHAVHAGLAGRTGLMVGHWNQRFTHVPISIAVARRRQLDPNGAEWHLVLGSTGQPALRTE